jgi:hypothetical protein
LLIVCCFILVFIFGVGDQMSARHPVSGSGRKSALRIYFWSFAQSAKLRAPGFMGLKKGVGRASGGHKSILCGEGRSKDMRDGHKDVFYIERKTVFGFRHNGGSAGAGGVRRRKAGAGRSWWRREGGECGGASLGKAARWGQPP